MQREFHSGPDRRISTGICDWHKLREFRLPDRTMELLQRLKESIAWIGGSLAGLTALCYAAGYFSFHAHLTMLGLDGTVDFPHEQMLLEGTHFFFITAKHLLLVGLALGVAIVAFMAAGEALARAGPFLRARARLREFLEKRPTLVLVTLLVVFAVAVVVHSDHFFYPLQDVTAIDNQLFKPLPVKPGATECPSAAANLELVTETVSLLLRMGPVCAAARQAEFVSLLNGFLVLLVALAAALSKRFGASFPKAAPMIRGLLGIYALVYLLLLPIAFGILVREPVHPVVRIDFKNGSSAGGFLVSRNDRGLTLWSPGERAARWLPAESVSAIRTVGQASVFPVIAEERK
jgi:hypothetical protein